LLRPSHRPSEPVDRRGVGTRPSGNRHLDNDRGGSGKMPLWLLILIIVLVVLALGGFGYSRY
jgi:hypothetical protein